jgi:acyl-CoA synthetase (AMP-forming)/AMP-acid ligase II
MSQSPQHPYGKRLLPSLVDEIAATDPSRILYSITRTKDPEDGFRDTTAACFARGVNRCAWYIEKHLGRSENFRTLAFVGPQDPIYGIVILACIKTGYKTLLLSPRNTVEANMSLLDETDCKTLLVPSGFPMSRIGRLVETSGTKIFDIPALQHWLNDGPEELYPFPKTFEEARLEPFVVLQTSGSTGMPKPITLTHGTLAAVDSCTQLPLLGYKDTYPSMCAGSRVYLAFPVNHSAGLTMLLPGCIFANITIVFGPFPPTSAFIDGVHRYGDVQQSAIAPMMLADLIRTPAYLENLSRLDLIAYGGGPLPKAVGDAISSRTKLFNCMGATECGPLPSQMCDPEDWDYLNFSPTLGSEFRLVTNDLYEQFIVRDEKSAPCQAIFETFPDIDEWRTKDLYAKHPFKEDYWLYQGRADDIIVFSTGQNFNPLHVEEIISARPDISAALVIGNGRPQSSLLIEAISPPANDSERKKLLDEIWETAEIANNYIPTEKLKVRREMTIFTSTEKPMPRAGKGTVQRKATVELYAAEIDALYEKSGNWRSGPYQEYRDGMAGIVQD